MERFNRQSEAIAEVTGRINMLEEQLVRELKHKAQLTGEKLPVAHSITLRPLETVFQRACRRATGIPDQDAIRRGLELL